MRGLYFVGLMAAASTQAAGCIIEHDGTGSELGLITARWDFSRANGAALGCPAGFDTVEVRSNGPESFIDLYDCFALEGTDDFIPGVYDVDMAVTNSAGTRVYANALPATVDITSLDQEVFENFIDDGGRAKFSVNLFKTTTNQAGTCKSLAVDGLKIDWDGPNTLRSEFFDCAKAEGNQFEVSDPLVAGLYNVKVTAVDPKDNPLGPATAVKLTIEAPNGYADLLDVDVDVGTPTP